MMVFLSGDKWRRIWESLIICSRMLPSKAVSELRTRLWAIYDLSCRQLADASCKVLVVEAGLRYGGRSDCSFDLPTFIDAYPEVKIDQPELAHTKGSFIIDSRPILLLTGGPICNWLIDSDASKYLEFRPVAKIGVYISDGMVALVPASKEDILLDPSLGLVEKRLLSKLVNISTVNMDQQIKFTDYMKTIGLNPKLCDLVSFGILACKSKSEATGLLVEEALRRISAYRQGLGRYSPNSSPYLYPVYGSSELAQAFARQCAVKGGTFIMSQYQVHSSNISGTYQENRWRAEFKDLHFTNEKKVCLRAVAILSEPINGFKETTLWIVIPRHGGDEVIRVLLIGSDSSCCPQGYYVLHAWTEASDIAGFQEELRHIVDIPSALSLKPGLPTAHLFGIFKHQLTPVCGLLDEEEFINRIG